MSENTITVAGNMTGDPVIRYSAQGKPSVYGTVAVSRRYQVNNEWQESTSFLNFKAFGPIAENIAASTSKGCRIIVTGRMETGEWEDKDGVNRKWFEIIVEDLGASLKFATAQVERVARDSAGQNRTQPATQLADEEPF